MTNNTTKNQVIALFPDNNNQEISAADMRSYVEAIFSDKETKIIKINSLNNLAFNNSEIYEGSFVAIWGDGNQNRIGLYISKINQPVILSDLIQLTSITGCLNSLGITNTSKIIESSSISPEFVVNFIDAALTNIVLTLPHAAGLNGNFINIKRIDSSVNSVTINSYINQFIDTETSIVLGNFENIQLVSDGYNWYII